MLSRVPAPSICFSTSSALTIWKSRSCARVGIGICGHQPVGALHLHSVPGVVEQCHVGALDLLAEVGHQAIERRLVEIALRTATNQHEARLPQRVGDQLCVVARIGEALDVLIAGVADHQRDAAVAFLRVRSKRSSSR